MSLCSVTCKVSLTCDNQHYSEKSEIWVLICFAAVPMNGFRQRRPFIGFKVLGYNIIYLIVYLEREISLQGLVRLDSQRLYIDLVFLAGMTETLSEETFFIFKYNLDDWIKCITRSQQPVGCSRCKWADFTPWDWWFETSMGWNWVLKRNALRETYGCEGRKKTWERRVWCARGLALNSHPGNIHEETCTNSWYTVVAVVVQLGDWVLLGPKARLKFNAKKLKTMYTNESGDFFLFFF